MKPELQELIANAYANEPTQAPALQRLIEAFEPPTQRQKRAFLARLAGQALDAAQAARRERPSLQMPAHGQRAQAE
jgi:hypothetical protein